MDQAIRVIAAIISIAANLYILVLFARIILDLIPVMNHGWRPRGIGLVLAEFVYVVTDPPIKFFRRHVKPVRMGPVALDLGFTITFVIVLIIGSIASFIAR